MVSKKLSDVMTNGKSRCKTESKRDKIRWIHAARWVEERERSRRSLYLPFSHRSFIIIHIEYLSSVASPRRRRFSSSLSSSSSSFVVIVVIVVIFRRRRHCHLHPPYAWPVSLRHAHFTINPVCRRFHITFYVTKWRNFVAQLSGV